MIYFFIISVNMLIGILYMCMYFFYFMSNVVFWFIKFLLFLCLIDFC